MKIDLRQNTIDLGDAEVRILVHRSHPELAVFADLLTGEECRELIRSAEPRLERSTAVDAQTGRRNIHASRTSNGMAFSLNETPLITRIERRIQRLLNHPMDHCEGLHILNYPPSAEYLPHYDYFNPVDPGSKTHTDRGGNRIATLIIYLSDVEAGGGTVFPTQNLHVHPCQGHAVFFSYQDLTPLSLHGGEPVIQGSKWIATKWLRQSQFK
jgi:prolyl 4-hydroxylase